MELEWVFFSVTPNPGKKVNDGLSFDLEFTGEFINADLGCVTHASLGTFLFLLFHRSLRFRGGSGRGGSLGGRFFGIGFRFGGGLRLGFGPGFGASFTGCFTWACCSGRSFDSFGSLGAFRSGLHRRRRRGVSAFVEAIHRLIDFVHHLFADARDFHQLLGCHASEFFQRGDSRGFDLLDGFRSDSRQNRERGHRRGQRGHLLFDLAALLFFTLDIDVPANQLAGQTDVLPLFSDGQ